jgi:acyl-CoA synthetase (AMP-forming)/AMP-acid ligase II
LSGQRLVDPASLKIPAVLVSISHFPPEARPQAGFSFAPFVYEYFITEGSTRHLAVFYGESPAPEIPLHGDCEIRKEPFVQTKNVLGNRVWYDANQNGIQDVGEIGEVRVRCPGLFSGYYKQPAGSGFDAGGFLRTGDLGCLDADGAFHFTGRSKDLLRVKGINVSPAEVEAVLAAHPDVEAAHVVGLPADGLDQEIVALVITRGEQPLPEAALRAHVAAALSPYKRPARYLRIGRDEVPLGGTAKPQRAALAALAARDRSPG